MLFVLTNSGDKLHFLRFRGTLPSWSVSGIAKIGPLRVLEVISITSLQERAKSFESVVEF